MSNKPKLLFIDDELENEKAFVRILQKEFIVATCTNVEDAKAALDANEYAVAIIDMKLPYRPGESLEDEAGLEICNYIRKNFIKTRGIVLTGHEGFLNYRKALETGIYDYLSKGDFKPKTVLNIALEASNDNYEMLISYDDKTYELFKSLCKEGKSKFQVIEESLEFFSWAEQCRASGYKIIAKKGKYVIPYEAV